MGCKGKAVPDCTGLIRGCLWVEPKVGKGGRLGDLGRDRSEKIQG